ncbi:MAG: polyribonucleotide nucleotidyltransferase [Acidobacteria bacterium]|nr:polyribonucleotide nucleotidyltransferase [Acidobacteriota bacterium]
MIHRAAIEIGGRDLSIETGRLAKQANGAALVTYGETVVLVTACVSSKPREGASFLPLTCDYREYTLAAGKFPGGFHKREGRPSEKEVLTSRMIDRPIRPLFPENYFYETQIIAFVYSSDGENDADVLAVTGASAALTFSDMPFHHPLAAVRIGYIDDHLVTNPTITQMETSRLNLVVVGTEDAIVMVESSAKEVSEDVVLEALHLAHEEIKKLIVMQKQLRDQIQPVKWSVEPVAVPEDLLEEIREQVTPKIREALYTPGKLASERKMDEVKTALIESYPEEEEEKRRVAAIIFSRLKEQIFREDLLTHSRRPDQRASDEIRPISIELDVLPRPHGSSLFTRGETQAIVSVTLGTSDDSQIMDTLDGETNKTFMVHYNFPPFSVGEVAFLRGPGRREIGHGALAEKALSAVVPAEGDFPYTIRVVSDILESNGSSSMATVCGGSLALMAAGIPVKKAVAGVAMGLVKEADRYAILSDIAGFEDHYGDMDFKVAGTVDGITALQMDIKITGITKDIMKQALDQARRGRLYILEKMNEAITAPRSELHPYAPRIYTVTIPEHRIKDLIGPGGKIIKALVEETQTKIDIENDGTVKVFAANAERAEQAIRRINELTEEAIPGKIYQGRVTRLEAYGAFVEIIPGIEGLLHISEVSYQRTPDIRDVMKVGDEITVKCVGIEPPNKIRLSMRALQDPPPGFEPEERSDRPHRPSSRGGSRDRRGGRPPRGGSRDRD